MTTAAIEFHPLLRENPVLATVSLTLQPTPSILKTTPHELHSPTGAFGRASSHEEPDVRQASHRYLLQLPGSGGRSVWSDAH